MCLFDVHFDNIVENILPNKTITPESTSTLWKHTNRGTTRWLVLSICIFYKRKIIDHFGYNNCKKIKFGPEIKTIHKNGNVGPELSSPMLKTHF